MIRGLMIGVLLCAAAPAQAASAFAILLSTTAVGQIARAWSRSPLAHHGSVSEKQRLCHTGVVAQGQAAQLGDGHCESLQ